MVSTVRDYEMMPFSVCFGYAQDNANETLFVPHKIIRCIFDRKLHF